MTYQRFPRFEPPVDERAQVQPSYSSIERPDSLDSRAKAQASLESQPAPLRSDFDWASLPGWMKARIMEQARAEQERKREIRESAERFAAKSRGLDKLTDAYLRAAGHKVKKGFMR